MADHLPQPSGLAHHVSSHVEGILAAAERLATTIVAEAHAEHVRITTQAKVEAERIVAAAEDEAQRITATRVAQVDATIGSLTERAEELDRGFAAAAHARAELYALIDALGDRARSAASELGGPVGATPLRLAATSGDRQGRP